MKKEKGRGEWERTTERAVKREDREGAKMRRELGILGISTDRGDRREISDECTVGVVTSAAAAAASAPPRTPALRDARLLCPPSVSHVSFLPLSTHLSSFCDRRRRRGCAAAGSGEAAQAQAARRSGARGIAGAGAGPAGGGGAGGPSRCRRRLRRWSLMRGHRMRRWRRRREGPPHAAGGQGAASAGPRRRRQRL